MSTEGGGYTSCRSGNYGFEEKVQRFTTYSTSKIQEEVIRHMKTIDQDKTIFILEFNILGGCTYDDILNIANRRFTKAATYIDEVHNFIAFKTTCCRQYIGV